MTDLQATLDFAFPEEPEDRSVVASVLQLDPQWPDPVAAALTTLDLWSGGHGIPLAGCSYSLFVDTAQIQAVVRFSKPLDPSRLALQAALLDVATLFVTDGSEEAAKAFLDRWTSAAGATSLI